MCVSLCTHTCMLHSVLCRLNTILWVTHSNVVGLPGLSSGEEIYVKMVVGSRETVYNVNSKIRDKEGIPPEQQHLTFNGRELEEECALGDYNILKDSTLYMKPP